MSGGQFFAAGIACMIVGFGAVAYIAVTELRR